MRLRTLAACMTLAGSAAAFAGAPVSQDGPSPSAPPKSRPNPEPDSVTARSPEPEPAV